MRGPPPTLLGHGALGSGALCKAERVGRNPTTEVEVPIHPRQVTMFKPSPVLTARIKPDIKAICDDRLA
jgi:nucleoid DNA-binding protein